MVDLGGFSIPKSNQTQIIAVIAVYMLVVVAFGFFVKWQSSRQNASGGKMASFLTGGGNLGMVSVAMITLTNVLAGGTMVSQPGLNYNVGFINVICVFGGFTAAMLSLGVCGRKVAILSQRTGATTILQLMRHRYQSKKFTICVGISIFVFSILLASGQLMMAAKIITTMTGASTYYVGLAIAGIVTVIYALSGGVKSMAKVAVFQGFVMIGGAFILFLFVYREVFAIHGSFQGAMEFIAAEKPSMLLDDTWMPLYAIGTAISSGWLPFAMAGTAQGMLTYRSPKALSRAIVLSTVCFFACHMMMSPAGLFGFTLNTGLSADMVTIYLSSSLLPGALAGLVISGCLAAIQSTVAANLIIGAASLAKDVYKDCIKPEMDDNSVSRLNAAALVVAFLGASFVAIRPSELTQLMNNFTVAGLAMGFVIPLLFGLYWKKATAEGAFWATISGVAMFAVGYYFTTFQPEFWKTYFLNVLPCVPAILVSMVVMILVSQKTQKVPLGILKVWFSSDYDEKFTREYNLK